MSFRILIPQPIAREAVDFLERLGYVVVHGTGVEKERLMNEIQGCHGVLLRTAIMDREVLQSSKDLKVVAKHGVGVDNIDIEAAKEFGIAVTNAPHSNSSAVAEHAFAMLLATARRLCDINNRFKATSDFCIRNESAFMALEGSTIGVVGLGNIGKIVARYAAAFGMKVLGYDPYTEHVENVRMVGSLEELFRESDAVTLHIPLNNKTKAIIGRELISMMKPGAIFINVCRGELTDETALINAFKEGRLSGGGFDVFAEEPPPANHPFFTMSNVIVSPHNSAFTQKAVIAMAMDAAQGIDDILGGRVPKWRIC